MGVASKTGCNEYSRHLWREYRLKRLFPKLDQVRLTLK
jgi:hypothetical protein